MAALARMAKWLLRAFLYALAVVIACFAGLVAFAGFTATGGNMVAQWVAELASTPNRTVRIEEAGPLLTGNLSIGRIIVSDGRGPFADIESLSVAWSPLALLWGTFHADAIHARSVTLNHLPASDSSTTEASTGEGLPIAIRLDEIEIPALLISHELVGRDVALAVNANARLDSESLAGSIRASRKDSTDARLDGIFAYAPAEDRLDLDLSLVEPQDGLLASLLRLPGGPQLAVTAKGSGPLSDWHGRLTAAVDGRQTLALEVAHAAPTAGVHAIAATGSGRIDALAPPELRPLLAGDTAIDLAVQLSQDGKLDIRRGRFETDAVALSANGRFDPTGDNDLKVEIAPKGAPVPLEWPLSGGPLRLAVAGAQLSVDGPAKAAAVNFQGTVATLTMPGITLEGLDIVLAGQAFDIANRRGSLTGDLSLIGSHFDNPALDRAIRAPMKLHLPITIDGENVALNKATIESASIGGTINASYALQGGNLTSTFKLFAVPDVAPPAVSEKLTGTIALAGRAEREASGLLSLSELSLRTNLLEAQASATLNGDNLRADIEGKLLDIGRLVPNAEGTASIEFSADGALDALVVEGEVKSAEARLTGYTMRDLAIAFSGKADPQAPTGKFDLTGSLDNGPVTASASLERRDGQSAIPELTLTVGSNRLSGSASLTDDFKPTGSVAFDFPDLALIGALAGQKMEGDLKGRLKVETVDGHISLDVQANGGNIRRDDLRIEAPNIALTATDIASLAITGKIGARNIASGANAVLEPVLEFNNRGTATDFSLNARYDNAPLAAKGRLTRDGQSMRVDLANLQATPRGIPLKLARPTTVAIVNGEATINDLTISAGNGSIAVSGKAGPALDLRARIAALPAALVNRFAPTLGAEGSISGDLTISGAMPQPKVTYQLDWDSASVAALRAAGIGALKLSANGDFAGERLGLDLGVSGPTGLSLSGGGSLVVSGTRPIDMRFSGAVPFALFAGQLAAQGFDAQGSARLAITVAGPATSPQIGGTISATGARLVDVRRNLALEGLAFQVGLSGERATISGLSARLSTGGSISGGGTVDILAAGLPADIRIRLENAAYVDGTMFNTVASGNLTLRGPLLTAPVLSGAVSLGKTAITIPERLPPSLAEIDVRHKNAPRDVQDQMSAVTRGESGGEGSSLALDLTVQANSQIFVRGRGVDAELDGALTIRGTTASPDVSGAFTLRRGRLSILNKRLEFTSGTITFGGGLVPIVNLVATTTSGATTITITVEGAANDPQITFSSAPALPQDEVLAQLIFGQSISKLSPLQIAQLADSVSQLAGGRSTSLFESLRQGIGIDDLDVGTDEQGRARVTAGKYLNDRTYLELQQDAETGGKAIINLDVGKGLKLRGEAGGDGSGGAGIFYEKEY